MKPIISKTMGLFAMAATLFSFTNLGGEGFEIFLNNKAVVQQFGKAINEVKTLRLNPYSANDQLTVKYHHCGQVGKNRIITVKNQQNKILKEWRFADATASIASPMGMNFSVKDILNLDKGNERAFKLYYASSELPDGRLLANIILDSKILASNR